ncbi:hypothetical protein LSAT2_017482 [Lamellibrachia satsuma]|nr:hypothetical protein LSAT2_017482 [Lamellibrachia satsuma]
MTAERLGDGADWKILERRPVILSGPIEDRPTDQFKVRVHWAPPFLPNDTITNFLGRYGKVHSITYEKSLSKSFEGVATGVRTLIMSGNRQELPHIMTTWDEDGNRSELLITVTGRQPLCLRCRQVGHLLRECFPSYCRHHGEYGHSTETCAAAGSYASVLKERDTAMKADDINIEEEREEGKVGEDEWVEVKRKMRKRERNVSSLPSPSPHLLRETGD